MCCRKTHLYNGLRIEKVVKNPQNVFIHQRARISSVSMTTAFESASYWYIRVDNLTVILYEKDFSRPKIHKC